MDSRIPSILDALDACANEMTAHADWMENLLRKTYMLWAQSGEYEANMAAIQATRQHAGIMRQRVETIEKSWLEAGEHSRRCGKECVAWCRAKEPRPLSAPPPKLPPEPEVPLERFALIELE